MGGGTSAVNKYPPESLGAALDGGRAEGLLTREMLDNLAGAGFSPGKRSSRGGSGFAKSHFDTPGDNEEIPPNVAKLLLRIGITSPDVDSDLPEQKSKLVAHIFECLGALQSLVNVSDLTYDPEMETQSVCERDTMAMGTLLHEMVCIAWYFLNAAVDKYILLATLFVGVDIRAVWRHSDHSAGIESSSGHHRGLRGTAAPARGV